MSAAFTGEVYVPKSEIVPGLSVNEYVLEALNSNKELVGAQNAGRLLAGDICLQFVDETKEKLHEVSDKSNGDVGQNEIIAPLLRVTEDFRDHDVFMHSTTGSKWERYEIWAIDEVTGKPYVETEPGLRTEINPRSISVYPTEDYYKLIKPKEVRRPPGQASAFRFALGLSIFDPLYQQSPKQIMRAHRHFELAWLPKSFQKN